MAKIVVVGSCNIDITVECDRWAKPGETIFGKRLTVNPGGKGANQAVAAARTGDTATAKSALQTAVQKDASLAGYAAKDLELILAGVK